MKKQSFLVAAVLFLSVMLPPCFAQPDAKPANKGAAPKIDAKADAVIRDLAAYVKQVKSLSYEIRMLMTVEMGEKTNRMDLAYEVAMERPNKFSMISKATGDKAAAMMAATIVSDGTNLFTYIPGMKKYTKAAAPKNLEGISSKGGAGTIMGANAGFTDALFANDPYDGITRGVESGSYEGVDKIDGKEAHHLKFTQQAFDWDLWVQVGDKPVLLKLVPDMTKMFARSELPEHMKNMKMETSLVFNNWKDNEPVPAARFQFTPPADATMVESFFERPARKDNPLLGKAAPDFELELLGGGKMSLAQHKGKEIVILDFWATWCGPCMKALPTLIEVADAYKAKGVVFYAVNQREKPETITAALKKNNWTLTVPLDKDGAVGNLYHVSGIPQTVIVGKDGTVQVVHVGFSPDLKTSLSEELDALLAGKNLGAESAAKAKEKKK